MRSCDAPIQGRASCIGPWCNGSTGVFGALSPGSSPGGPAIPIAAAVRSGAQSWHSTLTHVRLVRYVRVSSQSWAPERTSLSLPNSAGGIPVGGRPAGGAVASQSAPPSLHCSGGGCPAGRLFAFGKSAPLRGSGMGLCPQGPGVGGGASSFVVLRRHCSKCACRHPDLC